MILLFLCAGEGSRMNPITPRIHKSMIPIGTNCTPILVENLKLLTEMPEITQSYIVASDDYISEYGEEIRSATEYDVMFVKNDHSEYNNWYSVFTALNDISEYNEDILVVEGDLVLTPEIIPLIKNNISSPQDPVCFCRYRQGHEWSLVESRGKWNIVKDSSGMCMSGVSIVPKKLCRTLRSELFIATPKSFWDYYFAKICRDTLRIVDVGETIYEFDDMSDLLKVMKPREVAALMTDKGNIESTSSMTNHNFIINFEGKRSVVRIPGVGTEKFICRDREELSTRLALFKELTPPTEFFKSGIKISEYLEGRRTSDARDIPLVLQYLKRFHNLSQEILVLNKEVDEISSISYMMIDLIKEIKDYESCYDFSRIPENYPEISKYYIDLIGRYQHTDVVLCHRDLDPRNLLVDEDSSKDLKFIDLEYSGLLNKYWDLAAHVAELRISQDYYWKKDEYYPAAFKKFYEEPLCKEKLLMWEGIVDFVWSCWTIAKESLGESYGDYFERRWKSACVIKDMISQ